MIWIDLCCLTLIELLLKVKQYFGVAGHSPVVLSLGSQFYKSVVGTKPEMTKKNEGGFSLIFYKVDEFSNYAK